MIISALAVPFGANFIAFHNSIVSSMERNFIHCRVGFELCPPSCNSLRCCKATMRALTAVQGGGPWGRGGLGGGPLGTTKNICPFFAGTIFVQIEKCCAAKVAERKKKKTPNNPFFISKFLNLGCSICQQRAQWAGIASNRKRHLWQCRGLRRHLAGSAVPLLWLQSLGATAQTTNGWG